MSKNFTYTFLLVFLLAPCIKLSAQDRPDSSLTISERSALNLYNKTINDRLGIYRGPALAPYTLRNTNNPYFRDTLDYYDNGVVNYDHRLYYHVPLRYNIERDMLETKPLNVEPYTLLSDRINDFNLLGHHFILFVPAANNKIMGSGFYELLYDGKIQVLARHVKTLQTETQRTVVNVFYPKTTYYLKKGSVYYNVSNRGKFLDALADKKKELQQYLKDNKFDFNDNPARAMTLMAAYYDHLTN